MARAVLTRGGALGSHVVVARDNGGDRARTQLSVGTGHLSSLPQLAGALGLLKFYEARLDGPEPAAAMEELRLVVEKLEAGRESDFWKHIFEQLRDETGPCEE